jgi:hypothetical protein
MSYGVWDADSVTKPATRKRGREGGSNFHFYYNFRESWKQRFIRTNPEAPAGLRLHILAVSLATGMENTRPAS